ncbi:SanA/YdcF family protein [Streptosporangium sp. CA-135522]|uniref:SanA/YdcF family protein n=1 Tax=Streptosporangium sp. CA-135522 TaxID=3240072 RepID=UPI003D8B1E93
MPLSRKTLRRSYRAAVLLSLLAIAPLTWAWLASSGHRVVADTSPGWVEEVPAAPVALVLGAATWRDGPSPMLARRLDISAELYRAGKVKAILLSGDNGRAGYDEPTAMRDYLLTRRHIPAGALVLDYAGFDTWDSCVRARDVFGATRLTVVTQVFHLPRAVALCRTAGLAAFGVGDDSARQWASTYAYAAREFLACGKAFLDAVVLDSSPVFPGPRESTLDTALRTG